MVACAVPLGATKTWPETGPIHRSESWDNQEDAYFSHLNRENGPNRGTNGARFGAREQKGRFLACSNLRNGVFIPLLPGPYAGDKP